MNDFRLFAHGVDFEADAYLASTPLKFDGVWHKGQFAHDHPKSSGVFKILGDGQKLPLSEQETIAIEYLSVNREELKALARYPGVTTVILGLVYHIELDSATVGFSMGPSARLMRHALDIGISPVFYVSLDRRREWDVEDGDKPVASPDRGQ
jgi:hypothetical protein